MENSFPNSKYKENLQETAPPLNPIESIYASSILIILYLLPKKISLRSNVETLQKLLHRQLWQQAVS